MDAEPQQKRPQKRMKSGFYRTLRRLRGRGINGIDRRTGPGKDALAFRDEAAADLGGADDMTANMKALLDVAAMKRYLFRFGVEYVLTLPSPVNKTKRGFYPIVRDIMQLGDSLNRDLVLMGLERKQKLVDWRSAIQEDEDIKQEQPAALKDDGKVDVVDDDSREEPT